MDNLLKISIPTRQPGPQFPKVLAEIDLQLRNLSTDFDGQCPVMLQISINGLDGFEHQAFLDELAANAPYQISINVHEENLGFDGNFFSVLEGDYKYIWVIGDDDHLVPEAIATLVSAIRQAEPDYIFVGGYNEKKPSVLRTSDLQELISYTEFRVGAIAANVLSKNIVNKFIQKRSTLYFENWPQIALILNTIHDDNCYLALPKGLYHEFDAKKRWLAEVGQKSINSDLWETTDLKQYMVSKPTKGLQKSIDAVIFRGIGWRVLKSVLARRNSFDLRRLYKSLLR